MNADGAMLMDCETLVTPDHRQQLLVLGVEEFPAGATGAGV
jgi:hypothetical protein